MEESKDNYNLTIYVIRGDFLVDVDEKSGQGKMDPFARLTLGQQSQETKVAINQGKKPKWDATFRFKYDKDDQLRVEVFDKDVGVTEPELVASGQLSISQVKAKKEADVTLPLKDPKGASQGSIFLKFEFKMEEIKKPDPLPQPADKQSKKSIQQIQQGNLRIHVLRGEFLEDEDESSGQGKMDPFVKLVMGAQKFETKVCKDQGKKPTWNEAFLVNGQDDLKVEVYDKDEKNSDALGAGLCTFKNMQKSKGGEYALDILSAKGKQSGKVFLKFEFLEEKPPKLEEKPAKNVRIHVLKGEFLQDDDEKQGQGKMDPFVKLKIGTQVFETKVAEDQGKKPVWNEVFEIKYDKTAELQVEVLEKDAKSNDSLGSGKCALQTIKQSKQSEYTMNMADKKGKDQGKIYFKFEFTSEDKAPAPGPARASLIGPGLTLFIIRAELLNDAEQKAGKGKMDPFVKVTIGKSKFETKPANDMGKLPVWNEQFPFQHQKGVDEITVELWDKEKGSTNNLIGSGKGSFKEGAEIPITIHNKQKQSQGKVFLKFELPPAPDSKKQPKAEQVTIQIMRGEFVNDIDEKSGEGKMDPYVRLVVGNEKFQTKVAKDQGKTPKWDESFRFSFKNDSVQLEVLDEDAKKSDAIGTGKFLLSDIKKLQKEDFTLEVLDSKGQKQGKIFLKIKFEVAEKQSKKQEVEQVAVSILHGEFHDDIDEKLKQGKMDPYVKLVVGNEKFQTKVAKDQGKTPKWEETFKFSLGTDQVLLEVQDQDDKQSDSLGSAKFLLSDIKKSNKEDLVLDIVDSKGKKTGKITLKVKIEAPVPKVSKQDREQVTFQIVRGEFLNDIDEKSGQEKMDPYVRMSIGEKKFETKVAKDQGKAPKWGESFKFALKTDQVVLEVLDLDDKKSDNLGTCKVLLSDIKKQKKEEIALDVLDSKGQKQGKIFVKVQFEAPEKQAQQPELMIHVLKADLLLDVDEKQGQGKMDPYVKLQMGKQSFETKTAENSGKTPIWNQSFPAQIGKELTLEVLDRDAKSSESLGLAKYTFVDQKTREVTLDLKDKKGKAQGKIFLKFEFRSLKKEVEEEEEPLFNLKVFVLKGEFLVDVDDNKREGKMDPYTRLVLGEQKFQTNVASDQGKNPIWNQQFGFKWNKGQQDNMLVEVWDKDKANQPPDFLGAGNLTVTAVQKKGKMQQFLLENYSRDQTVAISKKGEEIGKVYLKFEFVEKKKNKFVQLDPKDKKFIESFSKAQPAGIK